MYPTCIGHCRCGCCCGWWLRSTGKLTPLSICNILILTLLRLVCWWRSRSFCWWWGNLDSTWRRWQTRNCIGTLFRFRWNLTAIFFLSNKYGSGNIISGCVTEIIYQNIKRNNTKKKFFHINLCNSIQFKKMIIENKRNIL